jgi:hypothetical protein
LLNWPGGDHHLVAPALVGGGLFVVSKPIKNRKGDGKMKLAIEQVEARLTAAWGKQVFVVPYRLAGNRYSYVVTSNSVGWFSFTSNT